MRAMMMTLLLMAMLAYNGLLCFPKRPIMLPQLVGFLGNQLGFLGERFPQE
jgi:hypothetical protein